MQFTLRRKFYPVSYSVSLIFSVFIYHCEGQMKAKPKTLSFSRIYTWMHTYIEGDYWGEIFFQGFPKDFLGWRKRKHDNKWAKTHRDLKLERFLAKLSGSDVVSQKQPCNKANVLGLRKESLCSTAGVKLLRKLRFD